MIYNSSFPRLGGFKFRFDAGCTHFVPSGRTCCFFGYEIFGPGFRRPRCRRVNSGVLPPSHFLFLLSPTQYTVNEEPKNHKTLQMGCLSDRHRYRFQTTPNVPASGARLRLSHDGTLFDRFMATGRNSDRFDPFNLTPSNHAVSSPITWNRGTSTA